MGLLSDILTNKREELDSLPEAPGDGFSPRPVELSRTRTGRLSLITEIKLRSPSAGKLSSALSVAERAKAYEAGGASMLSVLCDQKFFDGSYAHLAEARRACSLPLLCKEFIIDERQLDCAVTHGADAVLLIVRCLSQPELVHLVRASEARGLTPLVEVHGSDESQRARAAGARLIGVNSRDLDTLEMDAERATRVLQELPSEITAVHLSGIKTADDVRRQWGTRADALLIGETLMRLDEPLAALQQLHDAAGPS